MFAVAATIVYELVTFGRNGAPWTEMYSCKRGKARRRQRGREAGRAERLRKKDRQTERQSGREVEEGSYVAGWKKGG